jgi:hypothetical protein
VLGGGSLGPKSNVLLDILLLFVPTALHVHDGGETSDARPATHDLLPASNDPNIQRAQCASAPHPIRSYIIFFSSSMWMLANTDSASLDTLDHFCHQVASQDQM